MKAIGKITVDGVGFVDIIDEDSLLIGEYFLEYMRQSHDKPKKKSKRGRKKGDMMSCEDKIKKYVENKSSFYIKSFLNRQPRFTEDEIKRAISVLIKENYLYQISNEEIGVVGKKTRSGTGSHQEQ